MQQSGHLLSHIVEENIQTVIEHRRQSERHRTPQEQVADRITRFSGSMVFVYLHLAWFLIWFLLNSGWVGLRPFDPFPYGLLTMIVSLEAIFLSTFVLISQNRMSNQDKERGDLDLQINLLTERELTRVLHMLDDIQKQLGMIQKKDQELVELEQEINPDEILQELERKENKNADQNKSG